MDPSAAIVFKAMGPNGASKEDSVPVNIAVIERDVTSDDIASAEKHSRPLAFPRPQ